MNRIPTGLFANGDLNPKLAVNTKQRWPPADPIISKGARAHSISSVSHGKRRTTGMMQDKLNTCVSDFFDMKTVIN